MYIVTFYQSGVDGIPSERYRTKAEAVKAQREFIQALYTPGKGYSKTSRYENTRQLAHPVHGLEASTTMGKL